jgi:drug/metabolite transporter (DMT)-like permease
MAVEVKSPGGCRILVLSITYGTLSLSMVFVNKLILRAGRDEGIVSPDSLLTAQCITSWMVISFVSLFLRYSLSISLSSLGVCAIVNLTFVGAMLANSYTLKYLSIHMVTLLKCCSVLVTACGDQLFYHHRLSLICWMSLFLIVIGSALGVLTDLEFSFTGFVWMVLSIAFSSSYILLTKLLISHRNIPFFSVVFWNNLLGTFVLLIYIAGASRVKHRSLVDILFGIFAQAPDSFWLSPLFVLFSGLLGLALNLFTFSLLGETSATSYVVVGATKKIAQAFLSFVCFDVRTNLVNVLSVAIGLTGASLYTYLKWKEGKNGGPKISDNISLLSSEHADRPSSAAKL